MKSTAKAVPSHVILLGRLQSARLPPQPRHDLRATSCSLSNTSPTNDPSAVNTKLHEGCCTHQIIFFPSIIPLRFFPAMIRSVNILPSVRPCAWVSEKSVAGSWLTSQLVIFRSNKGISLPQFKAIVSQQKPIVQHMELCSMLSARLDGRGVCGERTHVFVWLNPLTIHLKLSQHF